MISKKERWVALLVILIVNCLLIIGAGNLPDSQRWLQPVLAVIGIGGSALALSVGQKNKKEVS
jgi:hypothetical protein